MSQVILYKDDDGKVIMVIPAQQFVLSHGIHAIAVKDVPAGKPFKIVDVNDLPPTPQLSWEIDDADLNDGVGGESNEFLSWGDL